MSSLPLHELWEKLFPPQRRWLAWLIIASLLLHVFFFMVITVRKGIPVPTKTPLLQVTALTAGTGRNHLSQADLKWLDWRDPSAPILPREKLPEIDMSMAEPDNSQNTSWQPAMPVANPVDKALVLTSQIPTLVEQMRDAVSTYHGTPSNVDIPIPPQLSGTVVELGGDLAKRKVLYKTNLPQPEIDRNLRVTTCLLGVNANGMVENVMVDASCDDLAIDQLAVRELKKWQFAPVPGSGLQWGMATVYWHFKGKTPVGPPTEVVP